MEEVQKTDVLSTQSTSDPDVVKGISESIGDLSGGWKEFRQSRPRPSSDVVLEQSQIVFGKKLSAGK